MLVVNAFWVCPKNRGPANKTSIANITITINSSINVNPLFLFKYITPFVNCYNVIYYVKVYYLLNETKMAYLAPIVIIPVYIILILYIYTKFIKIINLEKGKNKQHVVRIGG